MYITKIKVNDGQTLNHSHYNWPQVGHIEFDQVYIFQGISFSKTIHICFIVMVKPSPGIARFARY